MKPLPPKRLALPRRSKERLEAANAWRAQFRADELTPIALYAKGSNEPIDREAALARLRAGEVFSLEMEAITYVQRETPNRNFVRFKPGILASFAKTFAGQPFLRDHGQYRLVDRGGTISASKLEHNDDGTKQIRMRFELVKPWAVEGALDGTIDRFSIGWSRTSTVECSICACDWLKCAHWPGDKMDDGRVMELVFTGAEGTETSGVNVPAVLGTRIESISQLTAIDRATLADILGDETEPHEVETMDPKILAALGLPATATADDVAREIAARNDRLTLETARASTAATQLQTLQTEATSREAAQRTATVNDSIQRLTAAGKLKPGSDVEGALRRTADRDLATFTALVADMLSSGVQLTPVGQPLPTLQRDPAPQPMTGPKAMLAERPDLRSWLKSAGITEEQFEKHGASAVESVEAARLAR